MIANTAAAGSAWERKIRPYRICSEIGRAMSCSLSTTRRPTWNQQSPRNAETLSEATGKRHRGLTASPQKVETTSDTERGRASRVAFPPESDSRVLLRMRSGKDWRRGGLAPGNRDTLPVGRWLPEFSESMAAAGGFRSLRPVAPRDRAVACTSSPCRPRAAIGPSGGPNRARSRSRPDHGDRSPR
jgi:hypothetical protein